MHRAYLRVPPLRLACAYAVLLLVSLSLLSAAGDAAAQNDDYAEVTRLLRAGQPAEAVTRADQFLSSRPRDPQMRFLKGVALTEQGKAQDAITLFTRLTEDFPELPEPYNNLAVLYAGQNQFDRARAALEMAIRTNPSYATAHENLGDVYARLASQAYSRALQLDSGNQGIAPKLSLIRDIFSVRPGQARAVSSAPGGVGRSAAGPVAAAPTATPPSSNTPSVTTGTSAAPAAPAPAQATAPKSDSDDDVRTAVSSWAAAWSRRDVAAYLAAYGKDFDTPDGKSRKSWEEERRERILGKSKISVKLNDLKIEVSGDKAVAKFRQDYAADKLSVSSRKTLNLSRVNGRWLIVKESTGG